MQHKLAIAGGTPSILSEGPHYTWPRITSNTEAVVLKQLRETVSIYDRSGIFQTFEDEFAGFHGRRYALLNNSGTNSIQAMFFGVPIEPEDEVICPAYTFFATASPLFSLGAIPVLCDCGADGNIDPKAIEKHISPKTRAVMITHMWGIPCDIDEIAALCDKHSLMLLEDCSHAHGALYRGRPVGAQSHAAAFSLQGQKLVSGGEGGILLTDDAELYYRATLLGHYNNRAKKTIPSSHPLYELATTGFGLKHRAHPLAIAMALQQFRQLPRVLSTKRRYAAWFSEILSRFSFIELPIYSTIVKHPSWYAYVFKFKEHAANGVTVQQFFRALHHEGLIEADRPGSTRPLPDFPLFCSRSRRIESSDGLPYSSQFPGAYDFFRKAIKLPVWAFDDESAIVEGYCSGLEKVCRAVEDSPRDFMTEGI